MRETISVKGAKEHNLKNITVEIPRDQLVVITGDFYIFPEFGFEFRQLFQGCLESCCGATHPTMFPHHPAQFPMK